ncbi:MAG: hypothetical protein ACXWLF_07340 [Myxococcaceae bacterium]
MQGVVPPRWRAAALLAALAFAPGAARATTVRQHLSIVQLLQESEVIVRGRVASVTDGVDRRGIPYTEVTLQISEALKGQPGRTLSFRQFGLLAPKDMGDGRVNLMVTPAAWATFKKGEESIFFLRKPAAWTGLRTTAGLSQGQFRVSGAGVTNSVDNAGLFEKVVVDPGLLGDTEKRVMGTTRGAVNARGFTSLVKQAVAGKWVENGRMRHADH